MTIIMDHLMAHLTLRQLQNTKMETGKMLATWLKLDMVMVQSPQDRSQWLLVAIQIAKNRKFISKHDFSIIQIS